MAAPAARAQPPAGALHLLDVPYLPQSEALCGGAAVAMVMRFFGETGIYAETFSPLVDPQAGGIRGADLLADLKARGWTAESARGDAPFVRAQIAARRPVIALIEDRPARFHYVVVVGWARDRVIVHDPARAPYRLLDEARFMEAWSASDFWTLIATPPPAAAGRSRPAVTASPPPAVADVSEAPADADAACAPLVAEGVRLATTGDPGGGRQLLQAAGDACPRSPAPWRELAGIHVLASEWGDAAREARHALANAPADPLAARILGTALFLDGHAEAALDAWNVVGEPRIELVNVTGLERTRYQVVARQMALRPQELLTRRAFEAARRRLAELPAAQRTSLAYRPGQQGRAQVDAVVMERPLAPRGALPLSAMALRGLSDREISASLASPSGGGELWTASWRWWVHRPRYAASLAAPAPFGGTWRVDGFSERQTYAAGPSDMTGRFEESRRHAGVRMANWTGRATRWDVGAALDAWRGAGRSISLGAGVEQRLLSDRLALRAGAGRWLGGIETWTTNASADWRSSVSHEGTVWLARAGGDAAASNAPLALWPGAGTGQGRDVLLRAHPLLHDGVIRGGAFGRRLLHGGLEGRRWLPVGRGVLRMAPAVFLDAARAAWGVAGSTSRTQWDAGAGVRLALPAAGIVRVDLARGLRDGTAALSIGWTR